MAAAIPADERERIVALLREHGGNRTRVAKLASRSPATIQAIATQEGIPSEYSRPEKANIARSGFAERDRLATIDKMLDKGETLLGRVKDPREYKDVVMGLAVSIDKHRLETGEVTDRRENRRTAFSLEDEFRRLDTELASEVEEEGAP